MYHILLLHGSEYPLQVGCWLARSAASTGQPEQGGHVRCFLRAAF